MLDKLTYISSTNKEIHFGEGNIIINTNNFRDYEWKYSQTYKRIVSFEKDIASKQLPILLFGSNVKETANNIFEIIESDVLRNKYGKLYSGDYYMQGYFVASTKPSYTANGFMKLTLTFATDKPYWVKETTHQYRPNEISEAGLDYDYDYPYDYLPSVKTDTIINSSFASQDIKIVIYGACENPSVLIDDHEYSLAVTLLANEYAVINTDDKTIVKVEPDGTVINIFNTRNRNSYIFEQIPSGTHVISTVNDIDVDVTIIEERSEPKWQ